MLAHIYRGDGSRLSEKTLFLHGYPGVRSSQNRDLAENLARTSGRDSHVLLYSGLTQAPGEFSFKLCMQDAFAYVDSLLGESITRLDVVGHSWGGFLALNVAHKYKEFVSRLSLLSPLLRFPTLASGSGVRLYFEEMARENPALNLGSLEERLEEFLEIGVEYPTKTLIENVAKTTSTLFLQAREDQITPTSIAESSLKYFRGPLEFELIDTDHSFLAGRAEVSARLFKFFNA